MSRGAFLLWVAFPYLCLAVFAVGHAWRWRRDQFTWTTRSTQLLERRLLRPGILLFHLGLLAALGGHVLGILVPASVTERAGVSEHAYHLVSVSAGTAAGLAVVAGFAILVFRRWSVPRVAATTTPGDRLTYALLSLVLVTGTTATVGWNLVGGGYDYRETVGPWFRGIFLLNPHAGLMSGAPLIYQVHALAAWTLVAAWPFTRLVHAWSVPLAYARRSPILYRRRAPLPAAPSPALAVAPSTATSRRHSHV